MNPTLEDTDRKCHPPPDMDLEKEGPGWARQSPFDLRFNWGPSGATRTASIGKIVVVVDVLRFTAAVGPAVSAGVTLYGYRWRDGSARSFATSVGVVVADSRGAAQSFAVASAQPGRLARGSRLVRLSPKGSICTVTTAEAGATVVAGCLRRVSRGFVADRPDPAGRPDRRWER